jgi:hypothetical protein
MERAALGRLARNAAAGEQRNRPVKDAAKKIADLKRAIIETEQAITDHEADHAGGRI